MNVGFRYKRGINAVLSSFLNDMFDRKLIA